MNQSWTICTVGNDCLEKVLWNVFCRVGFPMLSVALFLSKDKSLSPHVKIRVMVMTASVLCIEANVFPIHDKCCS